MKNYDDDRLLAHKRSVDRERQAQAVLRRRHQQERNAATMAQVAAAPRPVDIAAIFATL